MIALLGRPDPATTQAIQFARGILEGSATAFYEVDGNLTLNRFVLSSNVPPSFHDQYLAGMNRLDPLHPRSASNRPIARLSIALDQCASQEAATYRAFAGQCGVADMIEFFFRRNDRIVAGMSVLWAPGCGPAAAERSRYGRQADRCRSRGRPGRPVRRRIPRAARCRFRCRAHARRTGSPAARSGTCRDGTEPIQLHHRSGRAPVCRAQG